MPFEYGGKIAISNCKKFVILLSFTNVYKVQMDFFPLTDSKNNLIFFCHLKFCHNIKIYFCSSRFSYLRNSFIRASIKITQYVSFFCKHLKVEYIGVHWLDYLFLGMSFFQFWWVDYYTKLYIPGTLDTDLVLIVCAVKYWIMF